MFLFYKVSTLYKITKQLSILYQIIILRFDANNSQVDAYTALEMDKKPDYNSSSNCFSDFNTLARSPKS